MAFRVVGIGKVYLKVQNEAIQLRAFAVTDIDESVDAPDANWLLVE